MRSFAPPERSGQVVRFALVFMQRAGYRLVRHSHYNGWYVPNGAAVNFGWDDRWRIPRKYYLNLPFRVLRDRSRRLRRRVSDHRRE
jgi:hypothetical protein